MHFFPRMSGAKAAVQIANIGLIEAIEKYDEKAKLDFKDYLIYYVRENIKNYEEKTNG